MFDWTHICRISSILVCGNYYGIARIQWSIDCNQFTKFTRLGTEFRGHIVRNDQFLRHNNWLHHALGCWAFHARTSTYSSSPWQQIWNILKPLLNRRFPFISQNTIDEWNIIFLIAAALYILPAFVFIIFGSGNVQAWNEKSSKNEPTAVHPWLSNIRAHTPNRYVFEISCSSYA